jgi:hypothetical protein
MISRTLLISFFTVSLLVLPEAVRADSSWQPRYEKDGIRVLSRTPENEKYQEFLAEVEVAATLAQAISLLQDNAACTRWLYRCKESRIIQEVSNQERFFYQVSGLPFPARARDSVFHATVSYNPDRSVSIHMVSAADRLPESDYVRIQKAYGVYRLEPIDDNKTRVRWQMYLDPAGALPAWIVNSMLTDLPFRSLQSFRQLVKEPPYSQAIFSLDEQGIPDGIIYEDSASNTGS